MTAENELSISLTQVTAQLAACSSQEQCLRVAYGVLCKKYHGEHWGTIMKLPILFIRDKEELWRRSGFLHCTSINKLLRILLIQSGWFKESDIKMRWTLIWFISPHQYVQVRFRDSSAVNVDIWSHAFGIKLGDYAHGFH